MKAITGEKEVTATLPDGKEVTIVNQTGGKKIKKSLIWEKRTIDNITFICASGINDYCISFTGGGFEEVCLSIDNIENIEIENTSNHFIHKISALKIAQWIAENIEQGKDLKI